MSILVHLEEGAGAAVGQQVTVLGDRGADPSGPAHVGQLGIGLIRSNQEVNAQLLQGALETGDHGPRHLEPHKRMPCVCVCVRLLLFLADWSSLTSCFMCQGQTFVGGHTFLWDPNPMKSLADGVHGIQGSSLIPQQPRELTRTSVLDTFQTRQARRIVLVQLESGVQ